MIPNLSYPVSRRNASLAKAIGLSGRFGSVIVIGMRVARPADANGLLAFSTI